MAGRIPVLSTSFFFLLFLSSTTLEYHLAWGIQTQRQAATASLIHGEKVRAWGSSEGSHSLSSEKFFDPGWRRNEGPPYDMQTRRPAQEPGSVQEEGIEAGMFFASWPSHWAPLRPPRTGHPIPRDSPPPVVGYFTVRFGPRGDLHGCWRCAVNNAVCLWCRRPRHRL